MKNTYKKVFDVRYETQYDIKEWVESKIYALGLSESDDGTTPEHDRTGERGDIIVSIEFISGE